MVCTPRFGAVCRTGIAFGKFVGSLKYHFDWNMAFVFGEDFFAEIFFEILADDEDYFAEAGLDCIID